MSLLLLFVFVSFAGTPPFTGTSNLRVTIQGNSASIPDFVESLRRELIGVGITIKLVGRSEEYDYSIVVAQETTLGSAAAAVIALDHNGSFVTSVLRSGRITGKGAFNASAKD